MAPSEGRRSREDAVSAPIIIISPEYAEELKHPDSISTDEGWILIACGCFETACLCGYSEGSYDETGCSDPRVEATVTYTNSDNVEAAFDCGTRAALHGAID